MKKRKRMGFYKRIIDKDIILNTYRDTGLDGVKTLLRGSDALISSDYFTDNIIDIYHGEELMYDSWIQIEKLITDQLPN